MYSAPLKHSLLSRYIVLLLLTIFWSSQLLAEVVQENLQTAIDVYSKAMTLTDRSARLQGFQQARQHFQQAIDYGANSAALYANLGTAALQAEQLGPAIRALREALHRDPNHPRASRNLAHARSLLPEWVPIPQQNNVLDSFFIWHRTLSLAERLGLAAGCFLLAATCGAAALRWQRNGLRNLALLPLALWATLAISAGLEWRGKAHQEAVVIVPETVARAADSLYSPARFPDPLPGGTELKILEQRDRWVQTRLANGREAWVQRVHLGVIGE